MTAPRSAPARVFVDHDGLRIGALDWGGSGPPLLLLHANGFCAGVFDPLARALTASFRVVGVDLRGHGESSVPEDPAAYGHAQLAGDVIAVVDALGLGVCRAVGSSLGGGVAVVVDGMRPGALDAMLLCEPIVFGPGFTAGERDGLGTRPAERGEALAAMTEKRRPVRESRADARASYAHRPPFDAFAPEVLDAYVTWCFADRPDGLVELRCPPRIEALIYRRMASPGGVRVAWNHLEELRARAVVVYGTGTDHPVSWFEAVAARARAPVFGVPGGHFFCFEDTARAAELVRAQLERD